MLPVGESILVVYQNLSKATRLHEFRLLRGEREKQKEKSELQTKGLLRHRKILAGGIERERGREKKQERDDGEKAPVATSHAKRAFLWRPGMRSIRKSSSSLTSMTISDC